MTADVAHVADVAHPGETKLDAAEAFIRRFSALPSPHAYTAVTLWAAHTHFISQLETTGRLACLSPEPGSGKTRVLEILDTICANPLMAVDLSMAAFFRIVEDRQPTILLDEVDAIFTGKAKSESSEDLRRVINNGYRTGAVVQRVGGKNRDEVQDFRIFTPVAMAGLGNLPDTLMSRSVIIRMNRRGPGETIEPYRDRIHRPVGEQLQAELSAWAQTVRLTYPELPDGVVDRDADVWEPLIAVADAAGGRWPAAARAACLHFIAEKPANAVSLGVRLLTDLRQVWPEDRHAMSTSDLLHMLAELDEAPWADLYGEGLTARKLARMLSEYDIRSTTVRIGSGTPKGYRREDMWDAWQRYSPSLEKGNIRNKGNKGNVDAEVADVADVADLPGTNGTRRLALVEDTLDFPPPDGDCEYCGQPIGKPVSEYYCSVRCAAAVAS